LPPPLAAPEPLFWPNGSSEDAEQLKVSTASKPAGTLFEAFKA
jgi:hypothetical protein